MELKYLYYFFCENVHEVFGPLLLQIALMLKYPKNRYNLNLKKSWQKCKASFDVKCGTKDFGLGYLGLVNLNLPDDQNSLKQV